MKVFTFCLHPLFYSQNISRKYVLVDSDITVTFTRTKDRRQAIQRENLAFTFRSGLDVNYTLLPLYVHILQY